MKDVVVYDDDPDGILVRFATSGGFQVRVMFHKYAGVVQWQQRRIPRDRRSTLGWCEWSDIRDWKRFGPMPATGAQAVEWVGRFTR